jgi:putative transcriptional regulator
MKKMLIINLKELMIKKGALSGKRVSYSDIESKTGIKSSTLSRIANDPKYNISRKHIEKLCAFFVCTPNDLMTIIPDPPKPEPEPEPPGGETDPAQGDEPLES